MQMGDAIKEVREQSPYSSRKDFAERVGLSTEGLRKIEGGTRTPEKETLDRILSVGNVPKTQADKLHILRDRILADRAGIDLNLLGPVTVINEGDVSAMASEMVGKFCDYLEQNEWNIPATWEDDMKSILSNYLVGVLENDLAIQVERP